MKFITFLLICCCLTGCRVSKFEVKQDVTVKEIYPYDHPQVSAGITFTEAF
jgi:hypothetical protein